MKIGGKLGYRLLRRLKPGTASQQEPAEPPISYVPKIKRIVGDTGWESLRDKIILDFGCGSGHGCLEMARHGARHVIGLDIRPEVL
jgi:2-polyprenyl-3-methyl-5-hydroxy-6-metoxy-1,4-benzoquinol methylase